jgi:hypothetical protein
VGWCLLFHFITSFSDACISLAISLVCDFCVANVFCAQSTKQKLKVELIPRDAIRDGLERLIASMERKIQDEKKKYAP